MKCIRSVLSSSLLWLVGEDKTSLPFHWLVNMSDLTGYCLTRTTVPSYVRTLYHKAGLPLPKGPLFRIAKRVDIPTPQTCAVCTSVWPKLRILVVWSIGSGQAPIPFPGGRESSRQNPLHMLNQWYCGDFHGCSPGTRSPPASASLPTSGCHIPA